jgi:hypothetical protein
MAVRRILVVANQTLGGEGLASVVRARIAQEVCEFFLVVPATVPPRDFGTNFGSTFVAAGATGLPTYDSGRTAAAWRLDSGLHWLRDFGACIDGEVGPEDPVQAVAECLAVAHYDEIIVSTLPSGLSRWLRQDLPHRLERRFKVPVTTVTAAAHSSS